MRVRVNQDLCQGHARCYSIAPEVFALDDEGRSVVDADAEVPAEFEERVHDAILNCPERAITWE